MKAGVIQVGDRLPERTFGPITRAMLALYAGASHDHNPIHIDSDFAKASGQPDVFAHGMLGMAQFGRLLTDWSDITRLESLSTRFTAIVPVGARLRLAGRVTDREEAAYKTRLTVALEAVLDSGIVALSGQAVLVLPSDPSQSMQQDTK